jgi:hypothetical protein
MLLFLGEKGVSASEIDSKRTGGSFSFWQGLPYPYIKEEIHLKEISWLENIHQENGKSAESADGKLEKRSYASEDERPR